MPDLAHTTRGMSGTVRGLSLGVCSLHAEGALHGTEVGKDGA